MFQNRSRTRFLNGSSWSSRTRSLDPLQAVSWQRIRLLHAEAKGWGGKGKNRKREREWTRNRLCQYDKLTTAIINFTELQSTSELVY
jgi:hypothetical protein